MKRACTRFLPVVPLIVTGLAMGLPSPSPLRAAAFVKAMAGQAQTPEPLPRGSVRASFVFLSSLTHPRRRTIIISTP
jgi:hypothetical protein